MLHDPGQLPLPFQHQPQFNPHDFIAACSNREALAWIDADWPDRRLALFGAPGSGKSHLLHVWAQRVEAIVLAGPVLSDLDGLPSHGAMALDDADTVRNETLLFHLLNTARERGLRLLLSARTAPSRWPVRLADLSSRLRATAAAEIRPPGDDLLAALLMRLLADRQLSVAPPVQAWLLLHLPRSAAVLREAVARLDRESLVRGLPITRQMAVRLLRDAGLAGDEADEDSKSGPDPSSEAHGLL